MLVLILFMVVSQAFGREIIYGQDFAHNPASKQDMSCTHRDNMYAVDPTEVYNNINRLFRFDEGNKDCWSVTAEDCKSLCQRADDPHISKCRFFYFSKVATDLDLDAVQDLGLDASVCHCMLYDKYPKLIRGPENIPGSFLQKLTVVGPPYCDSEKKQLIEKEMENANIYDSWENLVTCTGEDGHLTCTYKKTVGISKSTSDSSSESTTDSASLEFGFTYGMEAGDPLGVAKTSMEATATTGYSWSSESSTSTTFTQDASEETTIEASFTISLGQVSSMCQPVAHVADYTIRANSFKRVAGKDCNAPEEANTGLTGYEVRENAYCSHMGTEKGSLTLAANWCNDNMDCTMFFEDGKTHKVYTCDDNAEITVSTLGSRVYIKVGCPVVRVTASTRNGRTDNGQYFKFDYSEMAAMLGVERWESGMTVDIIQEGSDDYIGEIMIWNDDALGTTGRRNPSGSKAEGQWAVGDTIHLQSCTGLEDCFSYGKNSGGNEISKDYLFKAITTPHECQMKCQANSECEYFVVVLTGYYTGCWLKTAAAKDNIATSNDKIFGPKYCEG